MKKHIRRLEALSPIKTRNLAIQPMDSPRQNKASHCLPWEHPLGKLREVFGPPLTPRPKKAGRKNHQDAGGDTMHKLGIRMEQNIRHDEDDLNPEYPLLAACYSRFGLIRLAGKDSRHMAGGGKK